jgi:Tfp pilus assembly major pilin PilA
MMTKEALVNIANGVLYPELVIGVAKSHLELYAKYEKRDAQVTEALRTILNNSKEIERLKKELADKKPHECRGYDPLD